METPSVGIVGQGFVGSAIREGLKSYYDVKTYDIQEALSGCKTLEELVVDSNIIFVCLPTPMKSSGECSTDIVDSAILEINQICKKNRLHDRVAVIKSTVPPGTTERLDAKTDYVTVIFSPEFLTEANSFDDFKNQTRIIIGGARPATSRVKTMFRKAFPTVPIVKTSSKMAETIKYFINCFLSTKVSFANEMYQICNSLELDYDKVVEYSLYDDRIGKSHLAVPGPDGDLGFGGHCFPKDLSAMIFVANKKNVKPTVLSAVSEKNDEVRSNKDWEKMKGRAVVD